jgi:hypothetical protein
MSADNTLQDALTFDDMSGGPILEIEKNNHLLCLVSQLFHGTESMFLLLKVSISYFNTFSLSITISLPNLLSDNSSFFSVFFL